jgi:hypothetical protein
LFRINQNAILVILFHHTTTRILANANAWINAIAQANMSGAITRLVDVNVQRYCNAQQISILMWINAVVNVSLLHVYLIMSKIRMIAVVR